MLSRVSERLLNLVGLKNPRARGCGRKSQDNATPPTCSEHQAHVCKGFLEIQWLGLRTSMARGTGSILGGEARIHPACYEARPWHLASPCLLSPSQPDFCRSVQGPSSANALASALSLFHHLLEEFHLLTCVTASPRLFPASLNPGSLDTPLIPPVLPRKSLKLNPHFLKLYQPISDLCFAETVWPEAGSESYLHKPVGADELPLCLLHFLWQPP